MGSKAVDVLLQELDKVRQSLRDTDDTIKKLTGRESFAENRLRNFDNYGGPPTKRQNVGGLGNWNAGRGGGGRFQGNSHVAPQDSGDEDELTHKPAIQSSVVATQKDTKSRQDTIEKQNSSEKDKARNRRMFGVLMGTLQQFRVEEKQKEQQEKKRKAVEQKLEEKQKEEKETLKKEKQQLFVNRREKQFKIKQLENKLELAKLHEEWEEQTRTLMNFLRCDSKPHIFYLPKSHTEASLKKHEQSKAALEAIITDRKRQLEEEMYEGSRDEEQATNEEETKQKPGHNRNRFSRRNQGNDEEKMDVSDLEDDTGVNVDYGVSGDEENPKAAVGKETEQKKSEKQSSEKKHKSSRRSRETGRHAKDDGTSKQRRHRSSKQRKSESSEPPVNLSLDENNVTANEVNGMETTVTESLAQQDAVEDESENQGMESFDINDIPCPSTEPQQQDPNIGDASNCSPENPCKQEDCN